MVRHKESIYLTEENFNFLENLVNTGKEESISDAVGYMIRQRRESGDLLQQTLQLLQQLMKSLQK